MMSNADDVYRATVSELVANFRQALLALIPVAERAQINYKDIEPHRDWERLAECSFDVFVRSPIGADRTATGRELPLARYDIDLADYLKVSWLTPYPEAPHRGAVVRLLSRDTPFDTLQVVRVDSESLLAGERITLPIANATLALFRRDEAGAASVLSTVEAIE